MKMDYPSRDFDDAVAAVCHGTASEEQMSALGVLLRGDADARDAYLRRVMLHAHLASQPDLFATAATEPVPLDAADFATVGPQRARRMPPFPRPSGRSWALAMAACLTLLLGAAWWFGRPGDGERPEETSRAVAMLNRAVHARWNDAVAAPRLGAPLEPGTLLLDSGLAQIVFYNGARVVLEGPAELRLRSSTEAALRSGTLTAEVPAQARGFRILSPLLDVTDLGTAFGLRVGDDRTELHVFEGRVEFHAGRDGEARSLAQGRAAVLSGTGEPALIDADPGMFADLFDLHSKSVAAEAQRYDQWRESIRRLERDSSLWVHLDFEHGGVPDWRLSNSGSRRDDVPDATIIGCQWVDGRWATKPALEFRGISDRVRLHVPGRLESVTLAAWVRVQGLDRQINSLFMSDGFAHGTLHWLIRNDGVLGLTAIGEDGSHQVLASPPVLTIGQFGIWTHLAVVLDGPAREVVHYLNGEVVSRHGLRVSPPFHIGAAELGNWNPHGFPSNDPFLIRNFSGAVDEFCLFNRALTAAEIRALHEDGRPQPEAAGADSRSIARSHAPRNTNTLP